MTSFRDDPTEWERLDYRLLQNGAVSLYHRSAILNADVAWLAAAGYQVVRIDCQTWAASGTPHPSLAHALRFPDHYGANLDALADSLSDMAIPDSGGLALVLEHIDAYASATDRGEAHAVLDIFESASRHFLLLGRRFVVLAQSDDPHLTFDPVGGRPVTWNPKEWHTADRVSPT